MNGLDAIKNLPTGVQVIIGVLVACQIIVMLWALVRLTKDQRERIVGIPRPVWAGIIVLGQTIGPVIFLIVQAREHRTITKQHHYQTQQLEKSNSEDASTVLSGLYKG